MSIVKFNNETWTTLYKTISYLLDFESALPTLPKSMHKNMTFWSIFNMFVLGLNGCHVCLSEISDKTVFCFWRSAEYVSK